MNPHDSAHGGSHSAAKEAAKAFDAVAQAVTERLPSGARVRRALPRTGRLHVDRQLPFLCLYRTPTTRGDVGTEQLITSEAAYLTSELDPRSRNGLRRVAEAVAKTARAEFGAFLLLEIWSGADVAPDGRPRFLILEGRGEAAPPVADALEGALSKITVSGGRSRVEVISKPVKLPNRPRALFTQHELEALGCSWVGVEVSPVYREAPDGPLFPLVMRALRQKFGRALREAFFVFSRQFTTHRSKTYLSLGKKAVVSSVWKADEQLARVATRFDFLLTLNPTNAEAAWQAFRRAGYEKDPLFRYRPLPIDPPLLKRALYQVPIDRVEDPTLASLFLEKQAELDHQLSMLLDRGTRRFLLGSQLLYGPCEPILVRRAEEILERIPSTARDVVGGGGMMSGEEFLVYAERELAEYRKLAPNFSARVVISDAVTAGLMVSSGDLLIAPGHQLPTSRADALLQHEVGTHIVTYYNGRAQRLRQLATGLAGYDEFQEGLAVLAEYLVGGLSPARLRILAARVLAVSAIIEGASFVDVFRRLCRFGFSHRAAFNVTLRVFRGGGLTKDMIYLRGLVTVLEYLETGGDIAPLYVGKVGVQHIPIVAELQGRGVLGPAPLVPRFLKRPEARARLNRLRSGMSLYEMAE